MKEIRNTRARDAQGRRAGVVSQVLAGVLDLAVIIGLDFAALAVFGFVRFLLNDRDYEMPQPGPGANLVLLAVIGVVLLGTSWSGSGRAPGMALLGLRVVDREGGRLHSRRAWWRAVLVVPTLGLGLLWVLVSRANKSLYDLACGSAVIYEWRPTLSEPRDAR